MTAHYRIVEITYNNGNKYYRLQRQWILFGFIPTLWRTYTTHFDVYGPYVDWDLSLKDGDAMTLDNARGYIVAYKESKIHENDTKIKETNVIEKY